MEQNKTIEECLAAFHLEGKITTQHAEDIKEVLKRFILARDNEIKEMVIQATPKHFTREYRDTDKMRDDIINNINSYEDTKREY